MADIVLPFPPAILSGHANGNQQWKKIAATKEHRQKAFDATEKAGLSVPGLGDIAIHIRFIPPDRRSDRINMPNRCKAYFDGIAEALGVNDARFVPSYEFCAPEKPGRIEVIFPLYPQGARPSRDSSAPVTGMSPDEQEAAE